MGVGPSAESPQHGMAERPCNAASRNSCISGSSFLSPLGRELPVKKAASSCLRARAWADVPCVAETAEIC